MGRIAGSTSQSADQMREAIAAAFLPRRRVLFERSGNLVHVYAAFREATHLRVPVPPWVSSALSQALKGALHSDCVEDIAGAMGLHPGKGSMSTTRAENDERNLAIVEAVDHFRAFLQTPPDERDLSIYPEALRVQLEASRRADEELRAELTRKSDLRGEYVVVGCLFHLSGYTIKGIYSKHR